MDLKKVETVEEIKRKAEEEIELLTEEYKRKRKEIMRKKNADVKKFMEQEQKKLGKALLDYYKTTDINVVLKKLNLENKIKID